MDSRQPLAGQEPEPEEDRHGLGPRVVPELTRQVEIRLLEHVVRVDPSQELPVQPDAHHLLQAIAMPAEEGGQRRGVALAGPADELVVAGLVTPVVHRAAPFRSPGSGRPADPTAPGPETLYGEA